MLICSWAINLRQITVMPGSRGFTLIEVLVVLILLGLASALVLPKFPTIYERFKSKTEEDKFYQSLSVLGLKAYTTQTLLALNESNAPSLLELPEGSLLSIQKPIIYKANGLCLGGVMSLNIGGNVRTILLAPPYCEPSRVIVPSSAEVGRE